MPIYEYECRKCGETTEVFQKSSDSPLTACQCGGELRKLMSLNTFHLKGSGWYVTDYAKGKASQATSTPAEKVEKKDKTESKPAETKAD